LSTNPAHTEELDENIQVDLRVFEYKKVTGTA
jgi:hypothetical protein